MTYCTRTYRTEIKVGLFMTSLRFFGFSTWMTCCFTWWHHACSMWWQQKIATSPRECRLFFANMFITKFVFALYCITTLNSFYYFTSTSTSIQDEDTASTLGLLPFGGASLCYFSRLKKFYFLQNVHSWWWGVDENRKTNREIVDHVGSHSILGSP